MITEDLKANIESLSQEERRELSLYLLKLQLENDEGFLNTIRERTESYHTRKHVAVPRLQALQHSHPAQSAVVHPHTLLIFCSIQMNDAP